MFDRLDFDTLTVVGEEVAEEVFRLTVAEHARPWDTGRHMVPGGLDGMVPDVFLAAVLSTVDLGRLSGSDVVAVMRALNRLVSHFRAGVYEAMAETAYCIDADTTARCSVANEFGSEEVAAALSLTRRKADHDLGVALDLTGRLPVVLTALGEGVIDDAKARLFSDATVVLEVNAAKQVVDGLLGKAGELTTGQL